jgi:hypothetical protein
MDSSSEEKVTIDIAMIQSESDDNDNCKNTDIEMNLPNEHDLEFKADSSQEEALDLDSKEQPLDIADSSEVEIRPTEELAAPVESTPELVPQLDEVTPQTPEVPAQVESKPEVPAQVESTPETEKTEHVPVKTIINELNPVEEQHSTNKQAKTRRPRRSRALTMKDSFSKPIVQKTVRRTQRTGTQVVSPTNLNRKSRFRKRNENLISLSSHQKINET